MGAALTCALARWSPGLGDNTFMGWLTVGVYLLAAAAAMRAARMPDRPDLQLGRERTFWGIAAAVMLFLAVNKQLDLQSLATMIARCHAQLNGWYETRGTVQRIFILVLAGTGGLALAVLALLLRSILDRVWPALVGLGFVCTFVMIRAASFHHVDWLLGSWLLGIKMNWLLELPGPLLVVFVALRRGRRPLAGRIEAGDESTPAGSAR
jgi:hypothetical protein